ncbi:uncharacterized protein [Venturia canescens]|uniref:uncharacterized protein n=1 Tax=Venturia canescens TaxID=32260 RepID=UPI001C9D2E1A|nr:uncharacterized protein LOC122417835 [Venturia canescens]XP_043287591.1 uncharacterized protein LOC122417835 [Venturia canescens]
MVMDFTQEAAMKKKNSSVFQGIMEAREVKFENAELGLFHEANMSLEKEHFTEFEWSMKDWGLLHNTYIQGVSSNFFQLQGLDGCLCRITFSPEKLENLFVIELTNTLHIQEIGIQIKMNGKRVLDRLYSRPVPQILYASEADVKFEKCELGDRLKIDSPNRDDNSLKFEVYFFITKILESRSPSCQISPSNTVSLRDMFESKTLSDVIFVFDDKQLLAHKSVLAARSEVFQAMFSSEMKEKDTSRIEIVDTKAEIFEEFLRYLYTGELNDLKNKVEEMLFLADKYQICELKELCEEFFLNNVSEGNVVKCLILGDKCHCAALKKKALNLLENNPRALKQAIMCENAEAVIILKEMFAKNDCSSSEK